MDAPGVIHHVMNRGNATQHFALMPAGVWIYRIGGYQACGKWLKDSRERPLEL